ncbi:hypothetical protein [Abyssicoccus albus]|uniref:Uncharacterized protein n=1 Tax=Abyssicoccus albus TaxID=1817405 RepID=A0A3N5C8F4_9BACL|nr:hypothetical protein [Abyssicoccus albus]RPF54735.1 hypothetical protein EDD62_1695 [Abyssicoccus albus]
MLTEEDLQFIKDTREEVIANRTVDIIVTFATEGKENPFTGEVSSVEYDKTLRSVVTDRTSRVAAQDRIYQGEYIEQGDLWFSIDIDEFSAEDKPRDMKYVIHDGLKYSVSSHDPKGIGEMVTRWEFVGKRVY